MRFVNVNIFLSPVGSEGGVRMYERSDTYGGCEFETESHSFDNMTLLQGLGNLGNSLASNASQCSKNICSIYSEKMHQASDLQIKNILNSERHQRGPLLHTHSIRDS